MPSAANSYIFFFNDPATTEIYTLPLHDALPISSIVTWLCKTRKPSFSDSAFATVSFPTAGEGTVGEARLSRLRSEEHTSELQSHSDLVCRLLLGKKNSINALHV